MKSVDANTRRYIKIYFLERNIIFEFEIRMKLFRFENKEVLQKIYGQGKKYNSANDIVNNWGHNRFLTKLTSDGGNQ